MTGVKMSGVDATTGTPWELVGPQVAAVMGITDSGEWLTAAAGFPMQSPSTIEATVIVESLFAVPSPGNLYIYIYVITYYTYIRFPLLICVIRILQSIPLFMDPFMTHLFPGVGLRDGLHFRGECSPPDLTRVFWLQVLAPFFLAFFCFSTDFRAQMPSNSQVKFKLMLAWEDPSIFRVCFNFHV